jgi:hypothetical protein
LENLEEYLQGWIEELNIPNDYNQGPRCPYAKAVWDNSKAKIVKCPNYNILQFWAAVSEECEDFDTSKDITIIASDKMYDTHEIDVVVDALNIYLNVQNKDLWILASCNDLFSMVFIQKITKLDDASKILEKTPYYDKGNPNDFSKYVTRRRILRENLRKEDND